MSYDEHDEQQTPKHLREALDKANAELKKLREQTEAQAKQLAETSLSNILRDKGVPAHIQRWIKRDDVAANEAAVDKWLEENGADFGYQPGATEESGGEAPKEAPAQAASAQSVLTPELQEALAAFQEAFGGGTSGPRMPADQQKAIVDDVAGQLTIDQHGVDFNRAVQLLKDKGIPMGGDITYVGH